jgi:hypothetical protein
MELDCPKCGCELSAFDIKETGSCPSCGHHFSKEGPAIEPLPAPLPMPSSWADSGRPLGIGCFVMLWMLCGVIFGTAFLASSNRAAGQVVIGIVMLGVGYFLAGRFSESVPTRILIGAFLAAGMGIVPLAILYAGCMLITGGKSFP